MEVVGLGMSLGMQQMDEKDGMKEDERGVRRSTCKVGSKAAFRESAIHNSQLTVTRGISNHGSA